MMKKIFSVLLVILIITGCNFDFLDDTNTADSSSEETIWDASTDTYNHYDGDTLMWSKSYDYDSSGNCIFMKYTITGGLTYSNVYQWSGGNLIAEAEYNSSNTLSWFKSYSYDGSDNLILQSYYEGTSLQWFQSYEYNGDNNPTEISKFDESSDPLLTYTYDYTGLLKTLSSYYDENGDLTATISHEYEGVDPFRVIKETGTGTTSGGENFDASFSPCSFHATGGINSTSRNTANLTMPTIPTAPSYTSPTPTGTVSGYSWMAMWVYELGDIEIDSKVILNEDYLPVYLKTSDDVYLNGKPIEVDITYDGLKVASKKTSYDGDTVLNLDFTYGSNSFLSSIDTSGLSLLIPLRYEFAYDENNIPESIAIYNESTMIQRFEYDYGSGADTSTITLEEFAKNIHTIWHYNGNNTLIGSYVFDYDDTEKTLTLSVYKDAESVDGWNPLYNGKFVLAYDTDGNVGTFTSYNSGDSEVYQYSYSYDEFENRIAEMKLDADDIPEVVSTFDVATIFEDLKSYLPLP